MITPGILFAGLASVLPARALAQNATASDKHVGWVSSASGRSTSDILWSCFSILLVCTYKCIHFNVPSQKESEAGCFTRTWWWKWLKKIGWMMLIVLAPEIGVAIAMDQYLLAREQCHEESKGGSQKKRKVDENKVVEDGEKVVKTVTTEMNVDEGRKQEITNTHILFANMGAFNLRIYALSLPEKDHTQRNQTPPDIVSQAENTVETVDTVAAVNAVATVDKSTIMQEVSFPLNNWKQLAFYRTIFPDMKLPTEKEINDLSKADAFTKAFACIQSSWLIIQSIVRVSVGLPITQLELATMAFVVCALTMYLLWWHKPFGVESRTSVTVIGHKESVTRTVADNLRLYPDESSKVFWSMTEIGMIREIERREENSFRRELLQKIDFDRGQPDNAQKDREFYEADLTWDRFLDLFARSIATSSKSGLIDFGKALGIMVRNVFGNPDFTKPPLEQTRTLALYATGMLFSALHVAAWNWEFPSSTARELWRIFAIAATGAGPVTILVVLVILALDDFEISTLESVAKFLIFFLLFVYVASRIGLVVLIFYCFSSMPAGVYETVNWLQFLPHFS